jgi:GAF domain-containing protein
LLILPSTKSKNLRPPVKAKQTSRRKPEKNGKPEAEAPRKLDRRTGNLAVQDAPFATAVTITQTAADDFSTLSIPFNAGDTWSSIEIVDEKDRKWGTEEQALVRDVVDQLTLALQNAKLFQQTQKQNSNLEILNEMGRELTTQLDVQQVVESAYKYTSQLLDTRSFFVALLNNERYPEFSGCDRCG